MRNVQACVWKEPRLVPFCLFSRDGAVSGAGMGAYLNGWHHSPVLARNELDCRSRNSGTSEVSGTEFPTRVTAEAAASFPWE